MGYAFIGGLLQMHWKLLKHGICQNPSHQRYSHSSPPPRPSPSNHVRATCPMTAIRRAAHQACAPTCHAAAAHLLPEPADAGHAGRAPKGCGVVVRGPEDV